MPRKTIAKTREFPAFSWFEQHNNPERFAEVNGFLCGFICSGVKSEGRLWLDSLSGYLQQFDNDLPTHRDVLIELYKQVSDQIQHEKFGFSLAFPRTNLSLTTRTLALKKWCHGFLEGLQQGGIAMWEKEPSAELKDSLHRFDNISKLDLEDLDINENDEIMFLQIANFVELAVMQIYHTFNQGQAKH